MIASKHFAERVRERIGDVDPQLLASELGRAIRECRNDFVRFVCRADKSGLRCFEFSVGDGTFYALLDTAENVAVTVMREGEMSVTRPGKRKLSL